MDKLEAYKMDGLGNDFIIFDNRNKSISLTKDEIIKISSFESLSKLENEIGFKEKLGKTNFFRKGNIDEWKNVLSNEMIKKIEEKFNKEMKELNYLD